jgi:hypothetical protein
MNASVVRVATAAFSPPWVFRSRKIKPIQAENVLDEKTKPIANGSNGAAVATN